MSTLLSCTCALLPSQVLWLNGNALSRLANLDFNPTIKSLYAHNNRISTLKAREPFEYDRVDVTIITIVLIEKVNYEV